MSNARHILKEILKMNTTPLTGKSRLSQVLQSLNYEADRQTVVRNKSECSQNP